MVSIKRFTRTTGLSIRRFIQLLITMSHFSPLFNFLPAIKSWSLNCVTAPSPRRLERNRVLSFEGMKKGRSVETEEKGDQPLVVTNLLRFFLFALLPTPHYHAYYTALIMDFAFTARLFRSLLATFPTMTTWIELDRRDRYFLLSDFIESISSPNPPRKKK